MKKYKRLFNQNFNYERSSSLRISEATHFFNPTESHFIFFLKNEWRHLRIFIYSLL